MDLQADSAVCRKERKPSWVSAGIQSINNNKAFGAPLIQDLNAQYPAMRGRTSAAQGGEAGHGYNFS